MFCVPVVSTFCLFIGKLFSGFIAFVTFGSVTFGSVTSRFRQDPPSENSSLNVVEPTGEDPTIVVEPTGEDLPIVVEPTVESPTIPVKLSIDIEKLPGHTRSAIASYIVRLRWPTPTTPEFEAVAGNSANPCDYMMAAYILGGQSLVQRLWDYWCIGKRAPCVFNEAIIEFMSKAMATMCMDERVSENPQQSFRLLLEHMREIRERIVPIENHDRRRITDLTTHLESLEVENVPRMFTQLQLEQEDMLALERQKLQSYRELTEKFIGSIHRYTSAPFWRCSESIQPLLNLKEEERTEIGNRLSDQVGLQMAKRFTSALQGYEIEFESGDKPPLSVKSEPGSIRGLIQKMTCNSDESSCKNLPLTNR